MQAELSPDGDLEEILELLDEDAEPPIEEATLGEVPIDLAPSRRLGALAWVLVVAAAMLVMCVAAAVTFTFFLVRANVH